MANSDENSPRPQGPGWTQDALNAASNQLAEPHASRATLLRTLLVLLGLQGPLTLLSAFAGIFFTQWYQSPDIRIFQVVQRIYSAAPKINEDMGNLLTKSLSEKLRLALFDLYPANSTEVDLFACTHWLVDGQIRDNCWQPILDSIARTDVQNVSDIRVLVDNQKALADWKKGTFTRLRPMTGFDVYQSIYQNNAMSGEGNQRLINTFGMMKDELLEEHKILGDIGKKIAESKQAFENNKQERNGEIAFDVGFINHGAGDGTISPTGRLSFGQYQLSITSGAAFISVKAHSFQQIRFVIDTPKSKMNDLAALNNLLRKNLHDEFNFLVEVGTGNAVSLKGVFD